MGVNILEGKKAERIAVALEGIAAGQNVSEDIRDMVIADRNLLTSQTWGITEETANTPSYYQVHFDVDSTRPHVIWAPMAKDLGTLKPMIRVEFFNENEQSRFIQRYAHLYTDLDPQVIAQNDNYKSVTITILAASYDLSANLPGTIFFGEITANTYMTPLEMTYARRKIGAVGFENVEDILDGSLNYKKFQTLTDTEKAIAQANVGISNNVANTLVDKNLLTGMTYIDDINDGNPPVRTESERIISINPSKRYVLSFPGCTVSDSILGVMAYDDHGGLLYTDYFPGNAVSLVRARNDTVAGMRISIEDSTNHYAEVPDRLFFGELVGSVTTTLTDPEKGNVRSKIDAASKEELSTAVNGVLRYTSQTLTDDQKAMARQNIDAISTTDVNSAVSGVVKYSEQTLSEEEKAQARANIDAISTGDVNSAVSGVVKYSEQTLSDEEKSQARANIDAISTGDVNDAVSGVIKYSEQTLTDAEKTQARTNIGAISSDEVNTYVDGVIKYTAQDLDDNQKGQARQNIGAIGTTQMTDINTQLNEIKQAIIGFSDDVADVTKNTDGNLVVTYASGDSEIITLDQAVGNQIASVVYDQNYKLHFYDAGGQDIYPPILIQGGGSGTAVIGDAYITPVTAKYTNSIYGDKVLIQYNFYSEHGRTHQPVDGIATWTVNRVQVVSNAIVSNGLNTFDVTQYLSPNNNTIQLSISVDVGTTADIVTRQTWNVNAINMYFVWPFNDSQIHEDAFLDTWTAYGSVDLKTTHTVIYTDGEDPQALDDIPTTKSTSAQSIMIPKLSHGVHGIERWITADITTSAGTTVTKTTPRQYHEVIFVEAGDTTPIISIAGRNFRVNQYNTISIPITVYDPKSLLTNATLSVDGTVVGTWTNIDRSVHNWNYTPSEVNTDDDGNPISTEHVLSVTCKDVTRNVTVIVSPTVMDIEEPRGYLYKFKASDFATNEAVQNWESNGITASFGTSDDPTKGFDWVNGGLKTERVDRYLNETDIIEGSTIQQYLCIKAGNRMTINHQMFATDPKANGMTFKMVYKVKNCREYDAVIGSCYASRRGLLFNAHRATLYSSSADTSINVQYGENEYVEVEFDIYPVSSGENDDKYNYIMAWADGVISSARVYDSTDLFIHPSDDRPYITIGSDDCDVYVYLIKYYPQISSSASTNIDDHIANFILDAPNAEEMIRRFNRNDILVDSEIDYTRLSEQNPDLRVWLYDIPYMTNAKDDKVGSYDSDPFVPRFTQIYANGGDEYQLSGEGYLRVQGTSSVDYIRGAANTDFEFISLVDGTGKNLLANSTKDSSYGGSNNRYIRDDDNPKKAKVFTVAEGEDLGPDCIVIERDENRNPTKYIKAVGMKLNDDSTPITYANTKVNFASCEQVNNMCNAMWYQRYNPYPSLTKRDCMEFTMGVQFIKDHHMLPNNEHFAIYKDDANVPDEQLKYHMYSIANMGTSKKNIHIFHDMTNPDEVCIEVKDNGDPHMRMIDDDLSEEDWGGKHYFEMRYPDTKNPRQEIRDAWQRLVTWFATNNPNAATNEELDVPETYGNYTFVGHDRCPKSQQVLARDDNVGPVTVTQYAGTYTHDTFNRRMAKMLSECEDHMNMDSFVYHFIYLERHTMVDNVSKNNFWSCTEIGHQENGKYIERWDLSKAYDMDTSDGNDNQGKLVFDYGLEYNDTREVQNEDTGENEIRLVFNGGDSVWFVFCANLYEACQRMFTHCEAAGAWSSSGYHNFLLEQQRKIPERCWNQCYWYDYIRTYEDPTTPAYRKPTVWLKYLDGGNKVHQRSHYETFQELYMSSKYSGLTAAANHITIYSYAPPRWGGVIKAAQGASLRARSSAGAAVLATIPYNEPITIEGYSTVNGISWYNVSYEGYDGFVRTTEINTIEPAAKLTLTMYNKMYASISYGTMPLRPVKLEKKVPYTINFGSVGELQNAIINVNASSMIQAISGIEHLYPNNIVLSNSGRLREITIGTTLYNYSNPNLSALTFGDNQMLEVINVQNLPNASSNLDLSGCLSLVSVDATGSGFSGYLFANGGLIETVYMKAPVTLSMRNLAKLTDEGLHIEDYSKLNGLVLENMEHINTLALLNRCENLQVVRLIGVDWSMPNADVLERLYGLLGYDELGITVGPPCVLTGYAYARSISERSYTLYSEGWPGLTLEDTNVDWTIDYPITFYNVDRKTILKDKQGNDYVQYVPLLEYIYDPIDLGVMDIPTTPDDDQYTYTFDSWDNTDNLEAVAWRGGNSYPKGTLISHLGQYYEALEDNRDADFIRSKWIHVLGMPNGNYTSEGKKIYAKYTGVTKQYTVKWFDDINGTELKSITVDYGAEAVYFDSTHDIPTKNSTPNGVYSLFKGWDKSTGCVTNDIDVHAVWLNAVRPSENTKLLKHMNAAEIYAVSRSSNVTYNPDTGTGYWTPKDYIDIQLGHDYEFDNIPQPEVLINNSYFTGNKNDVVRMNDIDLFDDDFGSFTLAIDYEFTNPSGGTQTLFSCGKSNDGTALLRLEYNANATFNTSTNKINIAFGDSLVTIGKGNSRAMVVLRHIAGTDKLYVYSSFFGAYTTYYDTFVADYTNSNRNRNNNTNYTWAGENGDPYGTYHETILTAVLTATQIEKTPRVTTFGGIAYGTMGGLSEAAGHIYKAKLWKADLGDYVCRELASWPGETIRMHYCGNGQYNLGDGTGGVDHGYFIANSALPLRHGYLTEVDREGQTDGRSFPNYPTEATSWEYSPLRTFLNERLYKAFPYEWQVLIRPTRLMTRGNSSSATSTRPTYDHIFIPSVNNLDGRNDAYYNLEGAQIPWYSTVNNRIVFMGITIPEDASIFRILDEPVYSGANVKFGDIWIPEVNGYSSSSYYSYAQSDAFIYVDPDTIAKHNIIGGYPKDNRNNIIVANDGGYWVRAASMLTRSPIVLDNSAITTTYDNYVYTTSREGYIRSNTYTYSLDYYNMRSTTGTNTNGNRAGSGSGIVIMFAI